MKKHYRATIYLIEKIGTKQVYRQEIFKYRFFAWLYIFLEMVGVNQLALNDVFTIETEILPL